MSSIRVLFAPDYRSPNPYQALLAKALRRYGVEVEFPVGYRRGLPIFRSVRRGSFQLIHLHWPERYFERRHDGYDRLRVLRYPLELWATSTKCPVFVTAHNLLPHQRSEEPGIYRNIRSTLDISKSIFAHSEAAADRIQDVFGVVRKKLCVIPFGDHSAELGRPRSRESARRALNVSQTTKLVLMFGAISQYKGIDDVIRFWIDNSVRHRLVVVGRVRSDSYANELRELAGGCQDVSLRLSDHWLSDDELLAWLSAADCVVFNYREIFSSGAAALARSLGLPLLLPHRLLTLDLHEPHPHVFRFKALEDDFPAQLERALATPSDYDRAADWRRLTAWDRIAETTARVYRGAVGSNPIV